MKQLKNILLLIGLFSLSYVSIAQTPFAFNVNKNECFTYPAPTPNSYGLDSVRLITAPAHGTLSDTPAPFTYCPDSNFVGTDTAQVYACVTNGGLIVGCSNFTLTFNVQVICSLQVALIEDSSAVCIGGNRHFTAIPTGGTGGYTFQWSDGSTVNGACELNPGLGTCVTVTDGNGCVDNACSSINGCNLACTINYVVSTTPMIYANVSGGTQPYSYAWSNNTNTYYVTNLVPGTYCVTITDANACTATACYLVSSNGGCYFTYNISPTGTVIFASSIDSGLTPARWLWNFSDGSTDPTSDPIHSFSPGYYLVTMNVEYTNGDSCSYNNYIYIPNDSLNTLGCQATFYNYVDSAGTFHFVDYSAYAPIDWQWDFGDGTSSALQNPTHNYNSTGSWNVCLTTTDANGCSSSYCDQISNVPVQDVAAYLYHQTTVSPGFPVWVYLGYYNAGTVLMNGTVVYRYPAGTTVNATSVAPSQHDVANRLLTFNYSSLVPGTSDYIYIDLTADSTLALGTLADDTVWINPVTGDANPADNISITSDTVVGSWDPNDKAVSPKGEGSEGVVPIATKELSYRIRFQNTGTAPAATVKIRDIISNSIDLSSLKVTNASHAHTTEIIGSELVITFANINLVDSGADYEASQGFIDVHVKLKPGLGIGTQIFNTANIYFDFNAPVVTNTVVTTLGSVISGIESPVKFEFAIMPNPANSQVILRGDFEKASAFELINQLGQVVLSGPITSANPAINVSNLNSGIYLMRVKSGTQAGVQRLMIAR